MSGKMFEKYSHQFITGISFGLTSAVITTLGMIVGLNTATSSKLAVVAGIIIMAIADGLSDAMGLHLVEEAEMEKGMAKHNQKEIWLTTIFTFLSVSGFSLTFVIPILIFSLKTAILIAILWGMLLLIALNFYIAKTKRENPIKPICEHILLALFVIIISYFVGSLIRRWF
jgi:VIT1/CCC1 family predicted Fe2+/Mn2+ transporter